MFQTSLTVCTVRSSGFSRVRKPSTGLKPLLRTVKLNPPLLKHALDKGFRDQGSGQAHLNALRGLKLKRLYPRALQRLGLTDNG